MREEENTYRSCRDDAVGLLVPVLGFKWVEPSFGCILIKEPPRDYPFIR